MSKPAAAPSFEVIHVTAEEVSCNGGGGALGHPQVYLHMDDDGQVVCPYCSRRFVFKRSTGV